MLQYNHFQIVKMTPDEHSNDCSTLAIQYSFYETPFGKIIIASTDKGICFLGFEYKEGDVMQEMKKLYPEAKFSEQKDDMQEKALAFFEERQTPSEPIPLHIKGTAFQMQVWEALLHVPMGEVCTYGNISIRIGHESAFRAVGSAVGDNPVSLLIPCHRIITASGAIGQYHWGSERKAAILDWEKQMVGK
jgi:O-6-methylguanine DNA methyltransferase